VSLAHPVAIMSAPSSSSPSALHSALLQYLSQLQGAAAGSTAAAVGLQDAEGLDVAIQCLTEATGADAKNANIDHGLLEIFARGVASISAIESHARWPQFLALLKEKAFFDGAAPGSLEHAKRMEQARAKFEAKYPGEQSGAAASPAAAAAAASPAAPAAVSAEAKAAAEAAKNAGNALLGKGDHAGAVAKYTEAIALNPSNAIYRANRAAAHVNLKQFDKAIEDCKASIAIDPNYAKSHYRLGQSLAAQGEYAACLEPFERALALSGSDESMAVTIREQIKQAKAKLNPVPMEDDDAADPFAALGGMGGLASMLGGLGGAGGEGGAGGLGGLMQSMLSNPQMQDMMKNLDFGALMKDPSMAGLMGGMAQGMAQAPKEPAKVDTSYKPPSASSLFDDEPAAPAAAAAPKPAAASGAGAGAGAGGRALPPQLAAFLSTPAGRAAASDPDLQPVLEDIKANGVGAAMKYMGNPAIMQKITALMGPMMGGGK